MRNLLTFLKEQRDIRQMKLDEYHEALAELEVAQKRVDEFGDMGGIEGDIAELTGYIEAEEQKAYGVGETPCAAPDSGDLDLGTEVGGAECAVDEVVVTVQA